MFKSPSKLPAGGGGPSPGSYRFSESLQMGTPCTPELRCPPSDHDFDSTGLGGLRGACHSAACDKAPPCCVQEVVLEVLARTIQECFLDTEYLLGNGLVIVFCPFLPFSTLNSFPINSKVSKLKSPFKSLSSPTVNHFNLPIFGQTQVACNSL